jgi:hypothetical protein
MPQTSHLQGSDAEHTGAQAIDHIGPPRHPHRVTIMRLARAKETYEVRWRENVRADDGAVTRLPAQRAGRKLQSLRLRPGGEGVAQP